MKRGKEEKPHIGIYGRCNVGKSTILNFITEQNVALVSAQPGTTTDPVRKSFEIIDFAPVVFIDTAGLDDITTLGEDRAAITQATLAQIDMAILLFAEWSEWENEFAQRLKHDAIPYIVVYNNFDSHKQLTTCLKASLEQTYGVDVLSVDGLTGDSEMRDAILAAIVRTLPESSYKVPSMFEGEVSADETVMLVCPIDSEAPAGRLILPQVRAIRDLLDLHAVAMVVQPEQITTVLKTGVMPKLVVTDSQLFAEVKAVVPKGIKVTSFSILMARMKGDYESYQQGLKAIDTLKNGDRILILENCTHQSSCDDIGRVKIPRWLKEYTGCELSVDVVSGLSALPDDIEKYALAIQCGGCMVTRSQLLNRIRGVRAAGVPITNYGMAIEKLRTV